VESIAKPAALLLDAGNTLVYLDHAALAACARESGAEVDPETLARAEGIAKHRYEAGMTHGMSHAEGWDLHMRVLFESAGLSAEAAERALELSKREHARFNLWRKVPKGLSGALVRARAHGIRLGVISNSEGKLRELFERVGLASHFEVVLDSELEGVRKPDPEIFRRALKRMQVAAEEALYAGDIPHVDVDGARAVGMRAVLIDTLDHYPEYRDARRFASVEELLEAMNV
jgi:HAD superfamily hydrolase (TIGR01662 family)